jgi:hypothetical protein
MSIRHLCALLPDFTHFLQRAPGLNLAKHDEQLKGVNFVDGTMADKRKNIIIKGNYDAGGIVR